ncbi:hypothetical protein ES677_00745 [Bizionia gelidisalsuginis]|uniref:Late embryogenesis abundant protein LEA-2 subgroup domain-containing protein n=2 Tax=Bizionia TaxID=283785 RepID=A0A8H2QK39_9FLAO|nr:MULTISPECIES: hypothetical protein [Bizionia]TYB77384.1 hypothetical protein ES676_03570 [Bizionia saleffrena]TYC17934.1 hypothetical protein ES677_00745 [Bizionia gelidisalsuginis]
MKKLIILSTILISMLSCGINKKPEFLKVENINVVDSNSEFIILSADAFFNNPNTVSGYLKTDSLKVLVNNLEVANISSKKFKVPAKQEFSIPLQANIPTKRILNLNNLSSLLDSYLNKTVKVQYLGTISYQVYGFSHTYSVNEIQDVKIKL